MRRSADITRLSRRASAGCAALAVVAPAAVAAFWIVAEPGDLAGAARTAALDADDRIGAALISMIGVGAGVWALLRLHRVFQHFARGARIDHEAADRLRRFAVALAWTPAFLIATRAGLSVWLSRDAPPGARELAVSVTSGDVASVLFGALLFALAAILREAADLADEHRQIV